MKISGRLNQSILFIAIFTLVIVLFWAFLGINQALTKTENPIVSQKEINPINVGLDIDVIEKLRSKE